MRHLLIAIVAFGCSQDPLVAPDFADPLFSSTFSFRGDLRNSGIYPESRIAKGEVAIAAEDLDGPVVGSAAVAGGKVFIGAGRVLGATNQSLEIDWQV